KTAALAFADGREPDGASDLARLVGAAKDAVAEGLKAALPAQAAHDAARFKNIVLGSAFYTFCQRFPGAARRLLRAGVRAAVGDAVDVDVAFNPRYGPWDQRLCLVPDGDLFAALKSGSVRIVTDTIDRVTDAGVVVSSGDVLPADVIVTATGLELQFLGGATVEVDGAPIALASTRMYMGAMLSGVPNAAFVMGYTNASWTLKCELVCGFVARVLRHLRDHGLTRATPRWTGGHEDRPAIEMSSGYFRRAVDLLPRQGTHDPWRLHQAYFTDRRLYRRHRVDDGVLELG
ncbi:MAG: NAD(P)/FAD-dependent oxidoreductase, partial [Myxococcota bacterium]